MTVRKVTDKLPEYSGLVADSKPTDVPQGSTFVEVDSGRVFIFNGSTWYGIDATRTYMVSHSRTVAAAGNYADNDVMSNSASSGQGTPWSWSGVNLAGHIKGATIMCSEDAILAAWRLHLFSATPTTSEMDDNEAFNLTTADQALYVGFIDLTAAVDLGDFSWSQNLAIDVPYDTAAGTLYGILQLTEAETNETAGMTVAISLYLGA